MATKNNNAQEICLTDTKKAKMIVEIIGDEDLILCGKTRSYEREEMFKQSHPKGTKIPAEYQQPYSLWEKLITSIHWLHPIEFHDEDYSLYTESEWKQYMKENRPCILAKAFKDSWGQSFISHGYKDSTGLNGTDFKRSVKVQRLIPIEFECAGYDQHLAQTSGLSRTNVLTQQNVFHNWRCQVEITYLDGVIPKETLLAMIRDAGDFIGVGARRGEEYGRYHVGSVEIVQ